MTEPLAQEFFDIAKDNGVRVLATDFSDFDGPVEVITSADSVELVAFHDRCNNSVDPAIVVTSESGATVILTYEALQLIFSKQERTEKLQEDLMF